MTSVVTALSRQADVRHQFVHQKNIYQVHPCVAGLIQSRYDSLYLAAMVSRPRYDAEDPGIRARGTHGLHPCDIGAGYVGMIIVTHIVQHVVGLGKQEAVCQPGGRGVAVVDIPCQRQRR